MLVELAPILFQSYELLVDRTCRLFAGLQNLAKLNE